MRNSLHSVVKLPPEPRAPILFAVVFIVSGSLFALEFLLTRIFSYLLWYHYVFMVVSGAVLGLGLGALWVQRRMAGYHRGRVSLLTLGMALMMSYVVIIAVLYLNLFGFFPLVYMLLAMVPFAVGGAITSAIFTVLASRAHGAYFLDLLGTAAFTFASLFVLNNYGMVASLLFLLAAFALMEVLLCLLENKRGLCFLFAAVAAGAVFTASLKWPVVEQNFGYLLKSQKLGLYVQGQGENTRIEFTKWDWFSRTDVVEAGDVEKKGILMDGGSLSLMYRFNGDLTMVSKLKDTAAFLPYVLQNRPKVLVIGSGGGRDILLALLAGSLDITAVEINPGAVDAVTRFASYSGDLYNLPQVKTIIGDGRNYIEITDDYYDTIYLSLVMTQAAGAGGLALSENYVFTKEAIAAYLEHLRDDGQLVFLVHDEDYMTRIVATALVVFEDMGIPYRDAIKQMSIVASQPETSLHYEGHAHYPVVIIRKQPFTEGEIRVLSETASRNGLAPVYVPGRFESQFLPLSSYSGARDLIRATRANVSPTTDDRPFFYNFQRGLPFPIYVVSGLALYIVMKLFLPHYKRLKTGERKLANYFFLLGVGFMTVEVALIQKNALLLGHPTRAFVITVPLLLASSGLGSLCSKRLSCRTESLTALLSTEILISAGLYRTVLYKNLLLPESKAFVAAVIPLSLGFLMGMLFPRGITKLHLSGRSTLVPFMWGVNGVASLLGSCLAMGSAMYFGFTFSLLLASGVYYLAGKSFETERC
ncbi:MAG TPA: hypothetical protein GX510_09450 [Firmicutes bacterium]|nr:hypothetical protein [Candidatus Fermentithermobacillaceae bacterium]